MMPEDPTLNMDLFAIDIYDALGRRRSELQVKVRKAERSISTSDYVELALLTLLLDGDGTLGATRYDRQQPQIVELPHLFMSIRHRLLIDLVYAGLPNVDTAQHEAVQRAWNNICALCVDNQG